MALDERIKQLAQATPATTNATAVLARAAKRRLILTSIVVANTTNAAATYDVYLDQDGSTYNASTAIAMNTTLNANSTATLTWGDGLPFAHQRTAGNLAVKVGTANAITFTVNGIEL